MLKKIEKYLLLHFPNLWNVRLIPALLFIIPVNIAFWLFGYGITDTTFAKADYDHSYSEDLDLITIVSIFYAILCFIIWIFIYLRHNGLANLYPKKRWSLYVEWLMVVIVIFGLALTPVSLTHGGICKWKQVYKEDVAKEELQFVEKMELFMPDIPEEFSFIDTNRNYYDNRDYDPNVHVPIPVEGDVPFEYGFLNKKDFKFAGNTPTEFTGNSLLFYTPRHNFFIEYYDDEEKFRQDSLSFVKLMDELNTMRSYLRNGDKAAVLNEILTFDEILKKNGLSSNLEPEVWLDLIWNPPFFQLTNYNQISKEKGYQYDELKNRMIHTYDALTKIHYILDTNYSKSYTDTINSGLTGRIERFFTVPYNYIDYAQLVTGYEKVIHAHHAQDDIRRFILIALFTSLILSIFVFSFRVTKGRIWLLSLMITSALIIATVILGILFEEVLSPSELQLFSIIFAIWGSLFLLFFALFAIKVWKKKPKGKSAFYLNPLLWLLPYIFPSIYFFYVLYQEDKYNTLYNTHTYYEPVIEAESMVWISVAIVFAAMWFLTQWVKRWKSLPEE